MTEVFLSYARQDEASARRVSAALQAAGPTHFFKSVEEITQRFASIHNTHP